MPAPLPISLLHYTVCSVGTVVNVGLLGVILLKTPSSLRSYAVLVFSQTLLQTATCFTSLILFARLIPKDASLIIVFGGPANLLGSELQAFYLWLVMLHGHSHYSIMLAVCLSFRYYVILYPSPTVKFSTALVSLIYTPTAIIFTICSQLPLFDPESARQVAAAKESTYANEEMVTGIISLLDPFCIAGAVWSCALVFPAYVIIVILARKMYRNLAANVAHMSEKTRASHKEIVRGLVFQACLPALYAVSSVTYLSSIFNLVDLAAIDYLTHMLGETCVSVSPFLTFYFVQPYRRTIASIVSRKWAQTTRISTVSKGHN